MLTGNIGKPGAGCHQWAGNYKAALFQGSPWTGPGFKGWIAEDPLRPNLDPAASGKDIVVKGHAKDEEPAYWDHGDQALIVETPSEGRKNFTGQTHMPTPTKVMWFNNVNIINNAKWAYHMIKNVNPKVDMIVNQDIEMTATGEYSDILLPANSWMEFQQLEVTASCSNPFLQIWGKEGIKPLYDTEDDITIIANMAAKLADLLAELLGHLGDDCDVVLGVVKRLDAALAPDLKEGVRTRCGDLQRLELHPGVGGETEV